MSRVLTPQEESQFIKNRETLHYHLSELQADLEDFSNEDLVEYRDVMLDRINLCMVLILETDEDNE